MSESVNFLSRASIKRLQCLKVNLRSRCRAASKATSSSTSLAQSFKSESSLDPEGVRPAVSLVEVHES